MRIPRQFALVLTMASVLALACAYAAAVEGEDLGKGGDAIAPAAAKEAPPSGAATQPGEESQQEAPPKPKGGFWQGQSMLFVMLGGVFLLYIFMGRSKRKQAAKRKDMLASLKKGAKISTIGGILGTVIEVREDEVTVKVDETNNARLRLARWAIRGVGEEAKTENPDQRR